LRHAAAVGDVERASGPSRRAALSGRWTFRFAVLLH